MYRAQDIRELEPLAAKQIDCPMYALMEQAGRAAFDYIIGHYSTRDKVVVAAGTGNNGGDAYVVARLLKQAGYAVTMASIAPQKPLSGDALQAQSAWLATGAPVADLQQHDLQDCALLVDGLLGTGLSGEVKAPYAEVIDRINHTRLDVVSLDIPSGTHADTGQPLGASIHANATVTFVGTKMGLVTSIGKHHCGQLIFAPLSIGALFHQLAKAQGVCLSFNDFFALPSRPIHAHKGHFGRLLCIGGNRSMAGAIRLSGEAAMRCGAGLVKVYCHSDCRTLVSNGRPELMIASDNLLEHLNWADCIVFGPGLGKDSWSQQCFSQVISYLIHEDKPVVWDADGLNLLSEHLHKLHLQNMIITPHPAEAARLLGCKTAEIEQDRFAAVAQLSQRYQASCILKGAGTLIRDSEQTYICADGNPGMATAGMGDVLAGILGGLLAQGMNRTDAARYGTCLHAYAADLTAQQQGMRGMLASDIFDSIRQLIN